MTSADSLSAILGWISIACWIVVYSPQIYENFLLQSGEGLSVLFVVIWLLGDIGNLFGAILANLLPTVIILGVYYTICDMTLLGQIYYYRWKRNSITVPTTEDREPLLAADRGRQPPNTVSASALVIRYACATCFVFLVGIGAWSLSEQIRSEVEPTNPLQAPQWLIQSLGWTSALLYLGARIPQIFKNFKTRCEGLSPALFFFAILGNVTYTLSICAKSMDTEYLMMNASWLAGSGLTVFMDILVVGQIFYYRSVEHEQMSVFL
ncbi:PQ loop repeat-domain-containing protein [Amanita rubescens]|nr:PQ loop repeat-domain-containing protein [Amanita rubescens]